MGLFNLFSSKEVDEFALSLAADIVKRYPPDIDKNNKSKMSVDRLTRILESTFDKAKDFQTNHRLGLFRKAKLSNTFKWALKEKGYSDEFIDMATEGLVVYITRGSKA